jgi:predicted PP-loop superfamily ATPase
MVRAPQPETIRDYALIATTTDGREVELARVEGNHQRLRRHEFPRVQAKSIRLEVAATNGSDQARVFEIRCYG